MASIQIIDRKTLLGTKYPLQQIKFQKPDLDGKLHDQENEVYFRPDAIAVLLVDEPNQHFLFTKQFRLPTFLNGNDSGYMTEVCAGLIDEGESAEQTVHREVQEETGYPVTNLTKIGAVYSSGGAITEYVHLFIAEYSSQSQQGKGGGNPGEGEDIQLITMPVAEAKDKLRLGEFNDAKTLMLLQHYFLNL